MMKTKEWIAKANQNYIYKLIGEQGKGYKGYMCVSVCVGVCVEVGCMFMNSMAYACPQKGSFLLTF